MTYDRRQTTDDKTTDGPPCPGSTTSPSVETVEREIVISQNYSEAQKN